MKLTRHPSERGQAIVLIAFAIVGLVAMTGLAIDGGFAFSDRRHAQNAADAAALSGALRKINAVSDPVGVLGLEEGFTPGELALAIKAYVFAGSWEIAELHGFGNDILTNTVTVNMPPEGDGPYTGNDEYVQVIIETRRDTFFAKIVGIDQTHNRVEAIAKATESIDEPVFGYGPLIQVAPNSGGNSGCDGEFVIGGSGKVIVDGGGIFVNSSSECAFTQAGCNISLTSSEPVDDPDPVPVITIGGYNEDDCTDDDVNAVNQPSTDPIIFPDEIYVFDEQPPECSQAHATPVYSRSTDITTFTEGRYDEFPPVPREDGDYKLSAGTYCVSKLKMSSGVMFGDDVFIYVRYVSNVQSPIDITGGDIRLTAKTITDPNDPDYIYSGYLMYVEPNFNASAAKSCGLEGSQTSEFWGTIYAPYCDIKITGSTGTEKGFHSQFVGYTIELSGDGDLWFIYNPEEQGGRRKPAELNLAQ